MNAKKRLLSVLSILGIAILLVISTAAPAIAAYQGSYSGTMTYNNSKFASGEHDSSYDKGTVSVNYGCSGGGIFWFEAAGGGRCTSMASVSPRTTNTVYYTSNFTGGTQLWGTASGSAPYAISGRYCFNVR